jgi:hypothetical protein
MLQWMVCDSGMVLSSGNWRIVILIRRTDVSEEHITIRVWKISHNGKANQGNIDSRYHDDGVHVFLRNVRSYSSLTASYPRRQHHSLLQPLGKITHKTAVSDLIWYSSMGKIIEIRRVSLAWWWRQHVGLKRRFLLEPHGVIFPKKTSFIVTAVRHLSPILYGTSFSLIPDITFL